jgi:hypothetical protein
VASLGFQAILYQYYSQQGLPQANQLAYGGCSYQFTALVNNMLQANQIIMNGQIYPVSTSCSDLTVTYNWSDTTQTLSWKTDKLYSLSFVPITTYVVSSIKKVLNKTVTGTSYASAFAFNCPSGKSQVSFVKIQMSVAYCTMNDHLFRSLNDVLNNQAYFKYLGTV